MVESICKILFFSRSTKALASLPVPRNPWSDREAIFESSLTISLSFPLVLIRGGNFCDHLPDNFSALLRRLSGTCAKSFPHTPFKRRIEYRMKLGKIFWGGRNLGVAYKKIIFLPPSHSLEI